MSYKYSVMISMDISQSFLRVSISNLEKPFEQRTIVFIILAAFKNRSIKGSETTTLVISEVRPYTKVVTAMILSLIKSNKSQKERNILLSYPPTDYLC